MQEVTLLPETRITIFIRFISFVPCNKYRECNIMHPRHPGMHLYDNIGDASSSLRGSTSGINIIPNLTFVLFSRNLHSNRYEVLSHKRE